jgi:hypothetical protein
MRCYIEHMGWHGHYHKPHWHSLLCENGHTDILCLTRKMKNGWIEMEDALWGDGSGWEWFTCDGCGKEYEDRVYGGFTSTCPYCGHTEKVPEDYFNTDESKKFHDWLRD